MAEAGISTLGVLFGYGTEETSGTKPTTFKGLSRINEIGGINLEAETIDASALEDMIERSIAGRESAGGTFDVTVNLTDETIDEWETVIEDFNALDGGKRMWFEVWSPYLTKAFFVVAQPPKHIPMPDAGQNSLMTVAMTLTIEEYKGLDTAIKPTMGE